MILLNRLIQSFWVGVSLYHLSIHGIVAKQFFHNSNLLNAYGVPLAALTAPGNFYFLEFPVNENDSTISPICADGSPYSFAFRRGTDEHLSKLLIEFEGGPACWNDNSGLSCCDVGDSNLRKQVPWHDYMDYFRDQVVFQKTFPELGSCRGISPGFLTEAVDVILSKDNAITSDIPIPLRDDQGKGWWESLGGRGSDIRDWSYILLPHCSMDWHLGHQEIPQVTTYCSDRTNERKTDAVYHRGGTNVDAVLKWVEKQFPSGLDALVTTAGGKVGGCSDTLGPAMASSIAPAISAAKLSASIKNENDISPSLSSTLVVTEGSDLWNPDLPSPEIMSDRWNAIDLPSGGGLPDAMEAFVASSINTTQFIWMASDEGNASDEEKLWFMRQTNNHRDKFHVYEPQSKLEESEVKTSWCPLYTFPDSHVDLSEFFADVIKSMSWSSESSLSTSTPVREVTLSVSSENLAANGESRSRLTVLTIFILICGIVLLSWIIYYIVKNKNSKKGKNITLSPTDLWFIALTKYPLAFFFVSLLVPIILSTIAFSRNGLKINMDFDSYLQVNTDLENVKRNYNKAQENQLASLEIEETNCKLHGNSVFGNRKLLDDMESGDRTDDEAHHVEESMFINRKLLDEFGLDIQIDQKLPLNMLSSHHRELSSTLNYFSGGEWISIMYQNRKGGNVFEPDVLKAIHEFESSIYDFPGFSDYCFGFGNQKCLPIDSLVSLFFNNGKLVSDIDAVLRSFLVDKPALWKLDQYFGPGNLQSNVTRSFVFLKNMGGDQSAAHPFLRSFYRDFLSKHDQEKTYPAMLHTWNNYVLSVSEADDALIHDTLWSIGSLCFIAFMILLKVQSLFVVFSAMLGLILAFSVSYYWVSAHFMIQDITLIWVAGLFVMLGIGADDIFLMVDSFEHTKHEFKEDVNLRIFDSDVSIGNDDPNNRAKVDKKIEILRQRMKVAYTRAGSMMLVSSITTAFCFFSNAFGVLTVIQEFGIFMGMVVLINYLHVMTILPSSILVNEIYVAPLQKDFILWFQLKFLTNNLCHRNDDGKRIGRMTNPDKLEDAIAEKSFQGHASKESGKLKNIIEKSSNDMNFVDRYLVQTYAPFITRRSSYLICLPIILAIVLGVLGAMNFTVNDGTIVLYTSKYNLGRLDKLTNLYFNDNEDMFTTIEEDKPEPEPTVPPVPPPTSAPQPTPPPQEKSSYQTVEATVTWITPDEAVEMNLPNAVTFPPKDLNSSNQGSEVVTDGGPGQDQATEPKSANNGGSEIEQVGGSDQASKAVVNGESESDQAGGSDSDQASESVVNSGSKSEQVGNSNSDQASESAINGGSESDQVGGSDSDQAIDAVVDGSESEDVGGSGAYQPIESAINDGSESDQVGGSDSDQASEAAIDGGSESEDVGGSGTYQPSEVIFDGGSESEDFGGSGTFQPSEVVSDGEQKSELVGGSVSYQANEAVENGGKQVGGSGSNQASQAATNGGSIESVQAGGSSLDEAQQDITNDGSLESKQVGGSSSDKTFINSKKTTSGNGMRRRETIQVKLIWGVESEGKKLSLWITNSGEKSSTIKNEESSPPSFNLAEPRMQAWLLEVVEMAKTNPQLFVRQDKLTWIERLRDFATVVGVEFPIPERLFLTYIQLLKLKDSTFADLIQNAVGTSAPGLAGDFTFASITMMVDAVEVENAAQNISISENIYKEWTSFAAGANEISPPDIPNVVAQSSIFLDAYRVDATVDSTLMTWFVANGLCLLVILIFIQNLALSFMVMATIILILFCLGGLLFAVFRVPFGPVEALGVSIFIGLSANYSLHVVHAYHHSKSDNRDYKIKEAIFAVGSPIIASALSTMGASAFLFGCRTWIFIELGLLICSITGMALLFTMTFLFAWLVSAGPLPINQNGQINLHQWDLKALCGFMYPKLNTSPAVLTKSEQYKDTESVYSIEIVEDPDNDFPVLQNQADDGNYFIEVVEDLENECP